VRSRLFIPQQVKIQDGSFLRSGIERGRSNDGRAV